MFLDNSPVADLDLDVTDGFLIVADKNEGALVYSPLDNLEYTTIPLANTGAPCGVDYDPVDQMVYWTDIEKKTISRAFLDGSGQEVLVDLGTDSRTYYRYYTKATLFSS